MTAGSTPPQAWHICSAGFCRGWPLGMELAVRLPEGSGSRQGHIQEALKDVFILNISDACSALAVSR